MLVDDAACVPLAEVAVLLIGLPKEEGFVGVLVLYDFSRHDRRGWYSEVWQGSGRNLLVLRRTSLSDVLNFREGRDRELSSDELAVRNYDSLHDVYIA